MATKKKAAKAAPRKRAKAAPNMAARSGATVKTLAGDVDLDDLVPAHMLVDRSDLVPDCDLLEGADPWHG